MMNKKDFEEMVSYYLKPNSEVIDVEKIKSSEITSQDSYLKENDQLYAYRNESGSDAPNWSLIYSLKNKHYFYRSGMPDKGWARLSSVDGGGVPRTTYIERKHSIGEMNGGAGWAVGLAEDGIVYLLSPLEPFTFINWINENPFEVKQ